jgi:hypothetical protein
MIEKIVWSLIGLCQHQTTGAAEGFALLAVAYGEAYSMFPKKG